ncbi:nucleoside hydrolase [Naumannella huperziae]
MADDRPPRKIILDCDPGHDDAIALALAHGSPAIDLLAVTTVAGNQTLAKVTRNARAIAATFGLTGVRIAAGADRPLVGELIVAPDIHGETGLDGPALAEPTDPLDARHAAELIIDTVLAHQPGEVSLVPVGPLTNIALAARLEPRITERVDEVVLMGGAVGPGNRTPVAEFNIWADPEAAHIVFGAPWRVTMIGLDVTHRALATPQVRERIRALGSGPARFVEEMLAFYGGAYRTHQGFSAPPVHDPCAVAYLIDPTMITTRRAPITVELAGAATRGMTVVDLRGPTPAGRHRVALDLDADRFWDVMIDAIARIGADGG